ncbi:MAG: sulfur oxidation c-type cytochrome SoxA, partial [Acetobacteraceae bacterium]|nr:sulfur oxidation c-type cytochrome SoxA [Acetobacteraceae bacterium]
MIRRLAALLLICATVAAADERRSGFADMAPATQAMQRDDMANPGMLWVLEGEALWARPAGAAARSCAGCHGGATDSMRGVAARYPAFAAGEGAAVDLAGRIALCQARHQGVEPSPRESAPALALAAVVAHQSRGMPIAPPDDARLDAARAEGARWWRTRLGQLDLACAQCHDDNAGRRLAGSVIPQAHPTGYPLYRLEWQALGSLQRRMRGCLTGV